MKRTLVSKEEGIYRTESGAWYFRGSIPGLGRKEITLGKKIKTLRDAIRTKQRKIVELARVKKVQGARSIRFDEIVDQVMALKASRAKATQVSAELQFRKHILPWFNEHYPFIDQFNEAVVEEYIVYQQGKTPGRKLFNDIKHLRMVAVRAYRLGLMARPVKIRNPDPERNAGKRLTDGEVSKLMIAANPETRLQILMAVTMGMRKGEILGLSWDRVDFEKRTIHLRKQDTKIRRSRTMGMSALVLDCLARHKQAVGGVWAFPSRYSAAKPTVTNKTAWGATKRRAKVKCRFHDLRHTFLSNALLDRKINPLHVAVYAGVSLEEIQKTYLHPTVDDTRVVALELGENWGRL